MKEETPFAACDPFCHTVVALLSVTIAVSQKMKTRTRTREEDVTFVDKRFESLLGDVQVRLNARVDHVDGAVHLLCGMFGARRRPERRQKAKE